MAKNVNRACGYYTGDEDTDKCVFFGYGLDCSVCDGAGNIVPEKKVEKPLTKEEAKEIADKIRKECDRHEFCYEGTCPFFVDEDHGCLIGVMPYAWGEERMQIGGESNE